jgi:hypothetical protein
MVRVRGFLAWMVVLTCTAPPPVPEAEGFALEIADALARGRIALADEVVARARAHYPESSLLAGWSAVVADLLWLDDRAISSQTAAIRLAHPASELGPELRGRLGDLLFHAGRYGEAAGPLRSGAVGGAAERRAAAAAICRDLPFRRKQAGPLVSEVALLEGPVPEIVCGIGPLRRPFAVDTGSSVTVLSESLAAEVGVRSLVAAGVALDGTGRPLPVRLGTVAGFAVGEVALGSVPVAVVADARLGMRDLFGGPEHSVGAVLGLDVLSGFRMTIDPARRSIVLELPRGLQPEESVQCVRADGRCLIPVQIEGRGLWFVLDTGASHSSVTEAGLGQLPDAGARTVQAFRRVRSVGGSSVSVREIHDLVIRVSATRFAGVTLPVVGRHAGGVFPVHGVLGADLLGRCRLTLDRGRAALEAVQ